LAAEILAMEISPRAENPNSTDHITEIYCSKEVRDFKYKM
jgi:hypothetical protein